jgi:CRP-like cAMP-binding protein
MNQFEIFNRFLLKFCFFTDDELKSFNEKCEIKTLLKGERLINMNTKSNTLYFLIKGIVKYSIINNEGQEVVYNFRMENMTVTGYSFYNNNIPKFNVDCLEDCEVIAIPVEAVAYVAYNFKNGILLRGLLAEAHILELVNLLTGKDTRTVMERYLEIENQFPNINQRISQSLIANFLGVSQEHLSRLKKSRNVYM